MVVMFWHCKSAQWRVSLQKKFVVPVRTQGTVTSMGPVRKAGVKDKGLLFLCIGWCVVGEAINRSKLIRGQFCLNRVLPSGIIFYACNAIRPHGKDWVMLVSINFTFVAIVFAQEVVAYSNSFLYHYCQHTFSHLCNILACLLATSGYVSVAIQNTLLYNPH